MNRVMSRGASAFSSAATWASSPPVSPQAIEIDLRRRHPVYPGDPQVHIDRSATDGAPDDPLNLVLDSEGGFRTAHRHFQVAVVHAANFDGDLQFLVVATRFAKACHAQQHRQSPHSGTKTLNTEIVQQKAGRRSAPRLQSFFTTTTASVVRLRLAGRSCRRRLFRSFRRRRRLRGLGCRRPAFSSVLGASFGASVWPALYSPLQFWPVPCPSGQRLVQQAGPPVRHFPSTIPPPESLWMRRRPTSARCSFPGRSPCRIGPGRELSSAGPVLRGPGSQPHQPGTQHPQNRHDDRDLREDVARLRPESTLATHAAKRPRQTAPAPPLQEIRMIMMKLRKSSRIWNSVARTAVTFTHSGSGLSRPGLVSSKYPLPDESCRPITGMPSRPLR